MLRLVACNIGDKVFHSEEALRLAQQLRPAKWNLHSTCSPY